MLFTRMLFFHREDHHFAQRSIPLAFGPYLAIVLQGQVDDTTIIGAQRAAACRSTRFFSSISKVYGHLGKRLASPLPIILRINDNMGLF